MLSSSLHRCREIQLFNGCRYVGYLGLFSGRLHKCRITFPCLVSYYISKFKTVPPLNQWSTKNRKSQVNVFYSLFLLLKLGRHIRRYLICLEEVPWVKKKIKKNWLIREHGAKPLVQRRSHFVTTCFPVLLNRKGKFSGAVIKEFLSFPVDWAAANTLKPSVWWA